MELRSHRRARSIVVSTTRVVHCRKERYDVYIGRSKGKEFHYGNPFSHNPQSCAEVLVHNRSEAVLAYSEWLQGKAHYTVEPDRRIWILKTLSTLKGKVLGCWCKPLSCHGDVLKELVDANN